MTSRHKRNASMSRENHFLRTLWKSETAEIVNSNSEGEKGELREKKSGSDEELLPLTIEW